MINSNTQNEELTSKKSSSYVSSPINKIETLAIRLNKIFEEEINSKDSVIISYTQDMVTKLAHYISGTISRPASIGIAGETASGKSTITLDIIDTINSYSTEFGLKNIITRVNTDDYYYDRSEMVKAAGSFAKFAKHYDLDVPQALELELMSFHIKELLNGKEVYLPKYDMSGTAKRYDNCTLAVPSKIIISEGLFTLTEKIKDAFDFKIYVDINHQVQKERFYVRATERGLGDSADTIYKNASDRAEVYIRPCKEYADIVLSGESERIRYKTFLNKIIAIIQQEHLSKII